MEVPDIIPLFLIDSLKGREWHLQYTDTHVKTN